MSVVFLFILFISCRIVADGVQVLAGRTGNGKSYLVSLTGCPRTSCEGSASCTKETKICGNGVVDTIGLDDDGREYSILYEGQKFSLSGLTYPIYSLFETLEAAGVIDAEFYLVSDANNIRLGSTAQFFMNFVTKDLKCPMNSILNKFRAIHSEHSGNFDIIVPEGADHLDLKGKGCVLSLAKDWRDKVIMSDLTGIRSKVSRENCNRLRERKQQFDEIIKAQPKPVSTSDCGYDKVIGYEKKGNDWHVDLGVVSFGGGGGSRAITERAVDVECARRDDIRNEGIKAENEALLVKQTTLLTVLESIDKGLVECTNLLSGWKGEM